MLTSKQSTLRRFWYPVMPMADLAGGPRPFRLMGEDVVLFLDARGTPAALKDRCCHRTAKLSKGWCVEGEIICGYHGWTYNRDGRVTGMPQLEGGTVPQHATPAFHAAERYGYAWVALDEPLAPIPEIAEATDPGYRCIPQFNERWQTSPLRLMENSFDSAHFAFVHRGTFGNIAQPKASHYSIEETPDGFLAEMIVTVQNPPAAHRITGTTDATTTRHFRHNWYLPFSRRLDIEYPSGIRHIIFTFATPIDDGALQLIQFLYRNDTEADCPAELLNAWDAQVVSEDRAMLESVDPDATVDVSRRIEEHMPTDRPGLIMRTRLLDMLRANGEGEVFASALR
jgi:phenylpropionate dioxygenase-like ring-hydroxylating dioxygenase large terminal subunit